MAESIVDTHSIRVQQASVEPPRREEAFSSKKYLVIALVIGTIAALVLPYSFPVSCLLFGVAFWYFYSSAIIVLNGAAEGGFLEKPIHQLHAIAMEINSSMTSAALFPRTLFDRYHGPEGNLKGRPILMVNGYFSFGSVWHYQRQKLVEAGFGPIYTMNVGSGKSIVTYAKEIQKKVRKIQEETGRCDLALIGHSKGGLVSSYYATHFKGSTNVTDVVTIGSPLAGTPLAYLGVGYDAYEMRPDSEFHQELRTKIKEHSHIRFSNIASEVDQMVPLSSALLGVDPTRHLVLKDLGHLGLIFSSRVADQMCVWLKNS